MGTNDADAIPDRDLLLSAAQEVEFLLSEQPGLTGTEVHRRLLEAAAEAPRVAVTRTWHLITDPKGPYSFCGEFPGPGRETWHDGKDSDGLMERFVNGDRCCPLCVLALGKIAERSQAEGA